MFESKCPIYLWGDVITTACYIYNRTPQAKRGASPYELWFNKKLSLKHIRTFGSKAYANIPIQLTGGKFKKRARKGRMIGYSSEAKTYILWNEVNRTQIETRDVIFNESDHQFRSGTSWKELEAKEENSENLAETDTFLNNASEGDDSDDDTSTNSDESTSEISFDNDSEYESENNSIDMELDTASSHTSEETRICK
jgi:hypothetical protein